MRTINNVHQLVNRSTTTTLPQPLLRLDSDTALANATQEINNRVKQVMSDIAATALASSFPQMGKHDGNGGSDDADVDSNIRPHPSIMSHGSAGTTASSWYRRKRQAGVFMQHSEWNHDCHPSHSIWHPGLDGDSVVTSRTHRRAANVQHDPTRLANILRSWSNGDRACRLRILKRFVQDSEGKTGADLERYYGGAVSLFLTRISSWFRAGLSYELSCGGSGSNIAGLGIQLRAITVFLQASAGTDFVTEFAEAGGVSTLLDVLRLDDMLSIGTDLSDVRQDDVVQALVALSCVAKAGRAFKEEICECGGVPAIIQCMVAQSSLRPNEQARNLLMCLGEGNPGHLGVVVEGLAACVTCHNNVISQRMAAQALHTLLETSPGALAPDNVTLICGLPPQWDTNGPDEAATNTWTPRELGMGTGEYLAVSQALEELSHGASDARPTLQALHVFLVEAAVDMLATAHLQVAFEATRLLKLLLAAPHLRQYTVQAVVDCLHDPNTVIAVASTSRSAHPGSNTTGAHATDADDAGRAARSRHILDELTTAEEREAAVLFANIFSSQYNAAATLLQAMSEQEGLVPVVVDAHGVEALLGAATNRKDHDAQCAALSALQHVLSKSDQARARVQGVMKHATGLWERFQRAVAPDATPGDQQHWIRLASEPVVASDIRWRLEALGWDCNQPRARRQPLKQQIGWLHAAAATTSARRRANAQDPANATKSDKRGTQRPPLKAGLKGRPRTLPPHRRATRRATRAQSRVRNTPVAHGASLPGKGGGGVGGMGGLAPATEASKTPLLPVGISGIPEEDRDYKTAMNQLMRTSLRNMSQQALRFDVAPPVAPATTPREQSTPRGMHTGGSRNSFRHKHRRNYAASLPFAKVQTHAAPPQRPPSSQFGPQHRRGIQFSQSSDVSFQQAVVDKKGKSRAATEFAVSGQDDDAVLHFMRDIHRSEPIVGRGTRGAGTASVDVPSLRNRGRPAAPRPPRVAKAAAGVLLPATSAVQAAQIARLPNMFPFNQGETTAGLDVASNQDPKAKHILATKIQIAALRSRREKLREHGYSAAAAAVDPVSGEVVHDKRATQPGKAVAAVSSLEAAPRTDKRSAALRIALHRAEANGPQATSSRFPSTKAATLRPPAHA